MSFSAATREWQSGRLFMIIDQTQTIHPTRTAPLELTLKRRRALIGGAIGGAMVALLSSAGPIMADGSDAPSDPFILLLKGVYQPVVHGPDLGLTGVNLSD